MELTKLLFGAVLKNQESVLSRLYKRTLLSFDFEKFARLKVQTSTNTSTGYLMDY